MSHQGNTYLGYKLVLLVQPSSATPQSKADRLDEYTVEAIDEQIRLHLRCRFGKELAKKSGPLMSIASRRVQIALICQKTIKTFSLVHSNASIYILIDTGVKKGSSIEFCDFSMVQAELRKGAPTVHVELFRIQKPKKSKSLRNGATHDQRMSHDQNLHHVASRVCSALVEYRASWTELGGDDSHFIGRGEIRFLNIESLDTKAACPRIAPSTVLKKIIDVRDAIDLVCGCLDGAMHYFPPVPDSLQHLFAGQDTGGSVWARYKFPFGVWFRGCARICYDLMPTLFRYNASVDLHPGCTKRRVDQPVHFDECSMVHHFREYLPRFKREYGAMFDWLSLMQHYNAPTRLLDWTENILLALYFAVHDRRADCDGAIWVLNAGRLNEITRVSSTRRYVCFQSSSDVHLRTAMAVSHTWGELKRTLLKFGLLEEVTDALLPEDRAVFEALTSGRNTKTKRNSKSQKKEPSRDLTFCEKLESAVAVYPSRVNERLAHQLGTFTLHGGKAYDPVLEGRFVVPFGKPQSLAQLNRLVVDGTVRGKQFLDVFIIPGDAKRKIREQLKRIGVHAAAAFPELDYQSEYMKREWMIPKDGDETAGKEHL